MLVGQYVASFEVEWKTGVSFHLGDSILVNDRAYIVRALERVSANNVKVSIEPVQAPKIEVK